MSAKHAASSRPRPHGRAADVSGRMPFLMRMVMWQLLEVADETELRATLLMRVARDTGSADVASARRGAERLSTVAAEVRTLARRFFNTETAVESLFADEVMT